MRVTSQSALALHPCSSLLRQLTSGESLCFASIVIWWPQAAQTTGFTDNSRATSTLNCLARRANLWITWGSAQGLSEEAVELAAGGVEGALLVFPAVVNEGASVLVDHITDELLGGDLSQARLLVHIGRVQFGKTILFTDNADWTDEEIVLAYRPSKRKFRQAASKVGSLRRVACAAASDAPLYSLSAHRSITAIR